MKKSSDNTNRPRKLEEVFRDGFEPAEVNPRASTWHHIEQELEVQQASYYKKRLVWYRSVAAASVSLLLVTLGYFWYDAQTRHQFNVPAATNNTVVQNNTTQNTESVASANQNTTSEEAKILKKSPVYESLVRQTPPAAQLARSVNRKNKKNNLPNTESNPEQIAKTPFQSPDRFFGFANRNKITDKTAAEKTTVGDNNAIVPENILAANPAQTATVPALPTDSATVLVAKNEPTLKTDSAGVFTAALMPEETKKKSVGSRWALGGGTGSQYFEQNIKFDNGPGLASASNLQAYSFSNVARNSITNTVEAASEEFNENTQSAFSFRAAIGANYRINDKWSIETGLNYAENKAQTLTSYIIYKRPAALNDFANIKPENAFVHDNSNNLNSDVTIPVTIFLARLTDTDLSNAQVTVDKVEPFNMYYRYRQLGVPVRMRYQQGRGKWFNFVQAGGAVNVLLQTSILSDSPKVPAVEYSLGHSSPFRKWYFTGLGSVGRGLKISEVWQVQGSLDLAYSFSTLALSPDQVPNLKQQKPYYVGFGVSSSYVIGKK
ncbi:hypothetical protein HUW51_10665 [Adhaeribacter swui]|uniref:Outer membrane beta-barrel protein n=1 Tax=Adhaeribacter swui TaxID=2086471 RepID=A0A7G7G7N1_9BACT|nr:hypothetical protein [Adhaeribacter swui]QNF33165.1 hypothetical protein HUW51_10665 [Adhaeribacter swui]